MGGGDGFQINYQIGGNTMVTNTNPLGVMNGITGMIPYGTNSHDRLQTLERSIEDMKDLY